MVDRERNVAANQGRLEVSLRFAERYYVTTRETPRYARKPAWRRCPRSSSFPYSASKPSVIKRREEEKSGVLAFMSQNTRERSFGVITRERISIAMEPCSHKIEELDRNLESAIGASRADVRGFLEVCKVRESGLGGVCMYEGRGLYEEGLTYDRFPC
jgi:hypothetical protein